jgi:hypothetical protein
VSARGGHAPDQLPHGEVFAQGEIVGELLAALPAFGERRWRRRTVDVDFSEIPAEECLEPDKAGRRIDEGLQSVELACASARVAPT